MEPHSIPLHAAEGHIGDSPWHVDLADQVTLGTVATAPPARVRYRKVPISGFIDTVLILPVVNLHDSSLSNGEQPKESAASRASEFLLVERAIVIFIGGLEQLLDNGQKLVLVERAVAIAVYTYAWIDGRYYQLSYCPFVVFLAK